MLRTSSDALLRGPSLLRGPDTLLKCPYSLKAEPGILRLPPLDAAWSVPAGTSAQPRVSVVRRPSRSGLEPLPPERVSLVGRPGSAQRTSPSPTPPKAERGESPAPGGRGRKSPLAEKAPEFLKVGDNAGRAPDYPEGGDRRKKPHSWIRFDNTEAARAARRSVYDQTQHAVAAGGYVMGFSRVQLRHTQESLRGTSVVAPSRGTLKLPRSSAPFRQTKILRKKGVALDAALSVLKKHNGKVGVVSAASAFHCGGGFSSGGRHALEEAICVQTTLYPSILSVKQASSEQAYIPVDGVLLSPLVEVFRGGSDEGYPFKDTAEVLAAVVSVAIFNKNPKVKDAPLDAPEDPEEYERAVQAKMRSMLAAAVQAGCAALVVPDVGCGVYENDPETIGRILGELIRKEFWGHLAEVIVTGKPEFQEAAEEGAKEEEQMGPRASQIDRIRAEEFAKMQREQEEQERMEEERHRRELAAERRRQAQEREQEREREEREQRRRRREEEEREQEREREEREQQRRRRREEEEELHRRQEEAEEESAPAGGVDPSLCVRGCGRKRFRNFPTCCTKCQGPTGPHARDCDQKNGGQAQERPHSPQPQRQQAPRAPQPVTMQLQVPAGAAPGSTLQVMTPDGRMVHVRVPPGVSPGTTIQIQV
eukprot:TRINITY_DN2330_c0_g1_i1.p1 TRINITY_DN2330_c0_g1~~TRINITY_DN2330_c0_g1_i1.p1  ORF type:complete len:665 (+),score=158.25 TRINITY_DN2330_c0_g1_i1:47-1996(+)